MVPRWGSFLHKAAARQGVQAQDAQRRLSLRHNGLTGALRCHPLRPGGLATWAVQSEDGPAGSTDPRVPRLPASGGPRPRLLSPAAALAEPRLRPEGTSGRNRDTSLDLQPENQGPFAGSTSSRRLFKLNSIHQEIVFMEQNMF